MQMLGKIIICTFCIHLLYIFVHYVHPHPYKRTGEKQDGREWTGDNFLVFFTLKHWENSRKKLDGRQKIVVGGQARPKYRPSFYTGRGCIHFYVKKGCLQENYRKIVSFYPQKYVGNLALAKQRSSVFFRK